MKHLYLLLLFLIFTPLFSHTFLPNDTITSKKTRETHLQELQLKYKSLNKNQLLKITAINAKFRVEARALRNKQKDFVANLIVATEMSKQKIIKTFDPKIEKIEKSSDSEAEKKLKLASLSNIKNNLTKGFDKKLAELKQSDFRHKCLLSDFRMLIKKRDSALVAVCDNKVIQF